MNLIYISNANLKDHFFYKDFFFNFQAIEKTIILHELIEKNFGLTKTVSKRIGANISDQMNTCTYMPNHLRNLVQKTNENISVNKSEILKIFEINDALVLNPILKDENQQEFSLKITDLIKALDDSFKFNNLLFFPKNPKTPLASQEIIKIKESDISELEKAYPEEQRTIDLAANFQNASLVSAKNFLKITGTREADSFYVS